MNPRRTTEKFVDNLFARINYERHHRAGPEDFKLSNMVSFLQALGNPHLQFPIVHVAGTKGKGSVSGMVGAILAKSGLNTGVYSSPHLERIHQRIRFNGSEISDSDLHRALAKLAPVIHEFDARAEREDSRKLTFFEVITAAAFQAFAEEHVDAVVLEVGMGGRLDSTNVCQPQISVITNISLDHTRQLGSTIAEIAGEKAGIIKQGVPVVSGVVQPDARDVIRRIAQKKGANLIELGTDFSCDPGSEWL